jgi:hypothetical protein
MIVKQLLLEWGTVSCYVLPRSGMPPHVPDRGERRRNAIREASSECPTLINFLNVYLT